ncbi:Tetratricopeptide repeat [Pseudoxanthomonas suwonensis 11-1]|uniref:Tetratricopeptide repeat n=1 Tax=Pseudoxanthomonas suwonensis (strain 11-1) TaxID=743721 RepID=E6WPP8_PSEUU|nr:putative peptide modification system cyclase [Pseudoxanthomonas suwonensis]ADV26003.1 Tetratricopeptide repeat [Pseudoxanthomonas suwonensis 11-1]
MEGPTYPGSDAPQLRTILMTDLCDSTAVVERLGDITAASLFREHDQLVLRLQQQWRGRLIDRSDGLLLVFERPVDGLGFALDYQRSLGPLGRAHGVQLRARAGLHVGEVVSWANDEEAVRHGAKPLEISGLAKPLAARLMALANPGQILLSHVAETLARRAASELGPGLGRALVWKSHGRWHFKGLPEPLEIHEAGEEGIADMAPPRPADGKARRDLPLWRRPAAVLAQCTAVLALGLVLYLTTRTEPAIAFAERGWVVLADLDNNTGQAVLDDAVGQALRLSLGQSRHVNVVSDTKVRDTLARMRRPADAAVDRALAAEIAVRDGAWGVVLPSVSEVDGRVHVVLELIDPQSRDVIYVARAEGAGMESVLASIDAAATDLRERLGEARPALRRDSRPLPQVATASLDALRAYALGQEAYAQGSFLQAVASYERAVSLDPDFALAHIGLARAYNTLDRLPEGMPHLRRAQALRGSLGARDQMYLDAWAVQVDDPGRAVDAWMLMARTYPDFFPAQANVAYALEVQNQHEDAIPFATRAAVPQSEFGPLSLELLGRLHLARGERAPAREALEAAGRHGLPTAQAWLAVWHAVGDDFAAAESVWPADGQLRQTLFDRVSIYLDQRKWEAARAEAARVQLRVGQAGPRARQAMMPVAVAAWAMGDHGAALAQVEGMVASGLAAVAEPDNAMDQRDDAVLVLYAAILGQRLGDQQPARRVLQALEKEPRLAGMQPVSSLMAVVRARQALASGDAHQALALLDTIRDGTESIQARVARIEASLAIGDDKAASAGTTWLAGRRGLAYAEYGCAWCQQGLNVVDARLAAAHADALRDPGAATKVVSRLALPPARVLGGATGS